MSKYLIVGLGNIGDEYDGTRHNIGFRVLDAFAKASNIVFEDKRYGFVGKGRVKNAEVVLLKPSTYMNLSGNAVRYWINMENIDPANMLIICDDIALPFGTLRLKPSGSDGGHNGLKNIEEMLEYRQFARLRVGIGNDFARGQQIDFVLGALDEEQRKEIQEISKNIISGLQTWAFTGVERAMNEINAKKK